MLVFRNAVRQHPNELEDALGKTRSEVGQGVLQISQGIRGIGADVVMWILEQTNDMRRDFLRVRLQGADVAQGLEADDVVAVLQTPDEFLQGRLLSSFFLR